MPAPPAVLRIILANLIGNAFAHTAAGGCVRIDVRDGRLRDLDLRLLGQAILLRRTEVLMREVVASSTDGVLVIDEHGNPLRIDKAFSWEAPMSSHGMMHMVIHNAWAGDPYPIDTLFMFMANMAWNSSMNTAGTREMLRAKEQ